MTMVLLAGARLPSAKTEEKIPIDLQSYPDPIPAANRAS